MKTDVVVIGAGPGGLAAALAVAEMGLKTMLFEKLPEPGALAHPCSAVLAPLPGFVSAHWRDSHLYFSELDLMLPPTLIIGRPATMRFISPSGHEMRADFSTDRDFPVAAADKSGLLRLLAERASKAGAELRFGTRVVGLLKQNGQVVGVRTPDEEILCSVTLSAEGVSRQCCEEAGLYEHTPPARLYAFIVSEKLHAPAAREEHVGQITTLGQRYTSAAGASGAVVVPAAGKADIYFSIFADSPHPHTDESLWHYLEEYKREDPRVRDLFADAAVLERGGCRMVVRDAPERVVCDGFIGIGDAVTPGGHIGIVPAMMLGKQAAQTAAEAIRARDVSADSLGAYDRLFRGPFMRGLETEGKIMIHLTAMSDEEIDRVCESLGKMNLAPFFTNEFSSMASETARWIIRGLPLILRDWKLIQRIMAT